MGMETAEYPPGSMDIKNDGWNTAQCFRNDTLGVYDAPFSGIHLKQSDGSGIFVYRAVLCLF